jgi:hypothetical protein
MIQCPDRYLISLRKPSGNRIDADKFSFVAIFVVILVIPAIIIFMSPIVKGFGAIQHSGIK